ncbi:MAG TPA: hypothetical protein VL199_03290 [Burkholderiales bacterium]|jgi:hypothetical protein|nr:hypothetical protein [Burkholderiales bacterium]
MKLNGWRRLWLVASSVWFLFIVWAYYAEMVPWAEKHPDQVLHPLWVWLLVGFIVSVLVYALGAGVAWVIRGFRSQPK